MILINRFTIAVLLIILLVSCKGNDINEVHKKCPLDENKNGAPEKTIGLEEIARRIDKTGIENLKDKDLTDDSIEIRVWVGFDSVPLRGLILRRDSKIHEALYVPPLEKSSSSPQESFLLNPPKSGWEELWNELLELEICTLPDSKDIGMKNVYLDSTIVVIEVKSQNYYRTYSSFGFTPKEISERKQVKNVYKICKILSEEFEVRMF